MSTEIKVVIGANFGDEGKGTAVDYFTYQFYKEYKNTYYSFIAMIFLSALLVIFRHNILNAKGINDRFLRISVGIENVEDLIEDLRQAFKV